MNGNRMKYASTPTYGMQKRSFFKKNAPAHQAPEAPDFSKAPDSASSMPFPPAMNQPFPPMQPSLAQTAPQQPPVPPAPPYFAPNPAAPMMQQPMQVPFATPSFIPPGSGMPMPPVQPLQSQPVQQPPLGNTIPPFSSTNAFSVRSQGFVPPAPQASAPGVLPASIAPPSPYVTMPPFGTFNGSPVPPQQPMGYTIPTAQLPNYPPSPTQPPFGAADTVSYPPHTPVPTVKKKHEFGADKIWTVFLFGLLPLLFIPCLFVSGSWDALRYVFLGFTVVGLGAMWYRQMFNSSLRLIISMVYVALSVATIATLLQGGNDARHASATLASQPANQQQAIPADQQEMGMMYTPEPVVQETPVPAAMGPSEAERRLELFMSLWQINNTAEMVSLVQPSWCSQQENPSQALFNVLMNRTPEDFVIEEISGTDTDNSRTVTMRATINKNTGKAPTVYRFMVMMVKEGNEWYVNPNSLATNDEVEVQDENVVNNKNATGNVTEPPRTTVTPAPPASTLLYYNEGANYYHMDPNCVSVKSEYLPFDFSFAYGDLKSVMSQNGLSPCLKCNAPTNTLD